TVRYNNRKILIGLMQAIGLEGKETAAIMSLDKLDKIGVEKVLAEIATLGVNDENIALLKKAIETNSTTHFSSSDLIAEGEKELELIQKNAPSNAKFDITLARGLDYYTGCIFEVVSNEFEIGSIGGGGRYDNLTEMFGKKDLTGVGISFGLDRIYDVIEGLDKFPTALQQSSTQILFTHFDSEAQDFAFEKVNALREKGIAAEVYPDISKMKKQMKYANEKNIAFVCVIGSQEIESGQLSLKNMATGEQTACSFEEMIELLKNV
ncbi:MAG: His/Gly/Thr/Pro-type tRNA ligase C-terminal domain-containing protein, partial [Chitinophagales bacterium]